MAALAEILALVITDTLAYSTGAPLPGGGLPMVSPLPCLKNRRKEP